MAHSMWETFMLISPWLLGFSGDSDGKESICNAGDLGSIPGLGRSPGGRNGNPLQYSCLENPMDRGTWRNIVHWFIKSQTWGVVVPRWWRNRTGRPLFPPQIHQKIIWMLTNLYTTTSEVWWRTPGTLKGTPFSSKGGRTKYKRQKEKQKS